MGCVCDSCSLKMDLKMATAIRAQKNMTVSLKKPAKVTDELKLECKECFESFDESGLGKIPLNDLRMVLRSLDLNCTESELKQNLMKCEVDKDGTIDFDNFLILV